MSFIQIVSALRPYGADVLLLALGTTFVVSLLKKTVLKHCNGKIFVVLPFAVGLILYAVYRAAATCSADPFTCDILRTLEGGFSCGCAAVLYHNIYKQFCGERLPVLYPLLDAVPEETRKEVAETLLREGKDLPADAREAYFFDALSSAAPDLDEPERRALAALLAQFLSELQL